YSLSTIYAPSVHPGQEGKGIFFLFDCSSPRARLRCPPPMARVNEELLRAAAELLRPVIKRLLAAGVPFGRLEARLRERCAEVAESELPLPGRRQTDSRVSLLTGINRKEVRRIRAAEHASAPRSFTMNHASSLVSRWLADPRSTDRSGRPLPLPYQAK